MKLTLEVRFPDRSIHQYGMCFDECSCNILDIPNQIYLVVYKVHNHLYEVKYFLYECKEIGFYNSRSLKEMYNFIQNILKTKLFNVVQK